MISAREALYRDLEYGPPPRITKAARRGPRVKGVRRAPGAPSLGETVKELRRQYRKDPKKTLGMLEEATGAPVTETRFLRMLAELQAADADPAAYLKTKSAQRKAIKALCPPPPGYPSDVNPCSRRYELDDLRWIARTAPYVIRRLVRTFETAPLRLAKDFPSDFTYPLRDPSGAPVPMSKPVTVALFSDFGTGEYQSKYLAEELVKLEPDYAIHLGDVYYVGEPHEFEQHFRQPLAKLRKETRLFTLNANHEMWSGGFAYFDYLDSNRTVPPGNIPQEQEGSYFCLRSDRYQLIGIDTAYDYRKNGQYLLPELQSWLADRLREGKKASPPHTNILLSQNEAFGLGSAKQAKLFDQIARLSKSGDGSLLDFWFWGDEHYCALYEKSTKVPFVGSCIGHAGHPVNLQDVKKMEQRDKANKGFAKAAWVDTAPRFPTVRQDDLGNTGYCVLLLKPSGVDITYCDWRGKKLHEASFR